MESDDRFVYIEISESGNGSTGIESGNRFIPVELSECRNNFTGIESRNRLLPVEISEFGNNPTVIKSVIESESRRERSKEVYEILPSVMSC